MVNHVWGRVGLAAVVTLAMAASARSGVADDYFRGREMTIYVGYSAGGGYDDYARLLARHLRAHIPGNPNITTKNVPGAGSLKLTNQLYGVSPRDGTVLGMIGRGMPLEQLFGNPAVRFDSTKFNWIGSTTNEASVCASWHTSEVKNLHDFLIKKMIVAGTGPGGDSDLFVKVLNNVIGTHLDLITGYPGTSDINLALERGEVEGRCGWSWASMKSNNRAWLNDHKINLLVQLSTSGNAELNKLGIPLIMDITKTDRQRQILRLIFSRQVMGRPVVAPPSVPQERVSLLRQAFDSTMRDESFLKEAGRENLEISPVSGPEIQRLVNDIFATPPEIVAATKEASESTVKTQIRKNK